MSQWTLTRTPTAEELAKLSATKAEAVRVLTDNGGFVQSSKVKPISAAAKRPLRALKADGFVTESLAVSTTQERHRLSGQLKLTSNEASIDEFLLKNGKKRPAQAMILMRLQGAEAISFSVTEVKAISNATDQAIMGLIKAGLLEKIEAEQHQPQTPPTPNPHQAKAIQAINQAIKGRCAKPFLLFGVTGSGKTQVYLSLIDEVIKTGRGIIVMVPEISLPSAASSRLATFPFFL